MPSHAEPCETSMYHAYSVGDNQRSSDNRNNSDNNSCFPPPSINDFMCEHESTSMMDPPSETSSSILPPQIRFIFSPPSLPPMDVCSPHDLDAYGNSSAPLLEEGDHHLFPFDLKAISSATPTTRALPSADSANFNPTTTTAAVSSTFYSPHSPSAFHRPTTRLLVGGGGDGVDGGGGDGFSPSSDVHPPQHHHPPQLHFEHSQQHQRSSDDGHLMTTQTAVDTRRHLGQYLANTLEEHQQQQQQVRSLHRHRPPPAVEQSSSCTSSSATSEPANMGPRVAVSLPGFTSPESAFYQYQNRMEGQLCQICGELAAGFHHGAYVCEACKNRGSLTVVRIVCAGLTDPGGRPPPGNVLSLVRDFGLVWMLASRHQHTEFSLSRHERLSSEMGSDRLAGMADDGRFREIVVKACSSS
ncbi:unnamed protein product [Dibothriocephalus latus]|uniref:Nuclear receptor domain-containing protein n=1 Tax=Dibothriocephalus latus TaxID=60516 RepID=A0A3P7LBI0_DIBLA|nr:unnamed protein product [Dibothriocephalus latus]